MRRRGFTLIEVTLALSIMGGGLLVLIGLYAHGFRENQQSREDVAATAVADGVMSPLVQALTATNVTWSSFRQLKSQPSAIGWGEYINLQTGRVKGDPQRQAETITRAVFDQLKFEGNTQKPTVNWGTILSGTGMSCGLVILHEKDSAVVKIALRVVKTDTPDLLLAMPVFYTEARFQGIVDE